MQMDSKKVLTKAQITKLEKESKQLLDEYNQQNAAAAKKAMAAGDWMALKVFIDRPCIFYLLSWYLLQGGGYKTGNIVR